MQVFESEPNTNGMHNKFEATLARHDSDVGGCRGWPARSSASGYIDGTDGTNTGGWREMGPARCYLEDVSMFLLRGCIDFLTRTIFLQGRASRNHYEQCIHGRSSLNRSVSIAERSASSTKAHYATIGGRGEGVCFCNLLSVTLHTLRCCSTNAKLRPECAKFYGSRVEAWRLESHAVDRFSLQLEVDWVKRDVERLKGELECARADLASRESKTSLRDRGDALDKLHDENRDLATRT